ncbi:hypothetical protein [Mycoplasma sp. 1654_15]|uniref:hypothetical protein n=1 Tax=Mycoplasma sp. 1654_15 TaxID=2725994 RepID=UPI00144A1108|nr:hypothetical protein [Mycoplasma sp. 1654_15]QJB71047.1 hypothetical protein HF996_00785 [Mycoplasma sp. 1654_15]
MTIKLKKTLWIIFLLFPIASFLISCNKTNSTSFIKKTDENKNNKNSSNNLNSQHSTIENTNTSSNTENNLENNFSKDLQKFKNKETIEEKIKLFDSLFLGDYTRLWNPYLQKFKIKFYWLSYYSNYIFEKGQISPEEKEFLKNEEEKQTILAPRSDYDNIIKIKDLQDVNKLDKSRILPTLNKYITDSFPNEKIKDVILKNNIYILKFYNQLDLTEPKFDYFTSFYSVLPFFKSVDNLKKLYIIDWIKNNGNIVMLVENNSIGHVGENIVIFAIPKDQNISLFPSYDIADIVKDISK